MIKKTWHIKEKVVILYVLFAIIQITVIGCKQNYHTDEIFTYGSANNIEGCTFTPEPAPYTYQPAGEAYKEYMCADRGKMFHFSSVWNNQASDVHPPLYYALIHIASSFYSGRFTKWIAGGINIIFMLLTLAGIRKLLKEMDSSPQLCNIISIFFIASSGVLSATSFFRMYVMAMCEVVWITYLFIHYWRRENVRFYFIACLLSVAGTLTHYYFLVYLFFLSLFYCVGLLLEREIHKSIFYILTMGIAAAICIFSFPGMLFHIFGGYGRGQESFANMHRGTLNYWNNIKDYFDIMNWGLFGGMLGIIMLFAMLYFVMAYKHDISLRIKQRWRWILLIIPAFFYFILVSKIAIYNTDRYIVPIYAVTIVGVLLVGYRFLERILPKQKEIMNIFYVFLISIMIVYSWRNCTWPYLYRDTEKAVDKIEEYGALDCLYVYQKGDEWKINCNFVEISKMSSITFFPGGLDILREMDQLKNQNQYLIYIVNADDEEVLEELKDICPQITDYEKLDGIGYASVYHVFGWNETM